MLFCVDNGCRLNVGKKTIPGGCDPAPGISHPHELTNLVMPSDGWMCDKTQKQKSSTSVSGNYLTLNEVQERKKSS